MTVFLGVMNMRRILVTGAARGIGKVIATRLAQDGAQLVIGDLDQAACSQVAADLPGQKHIGMAFDVTDEAAVEAAFDAIETGGPLSGVVCNAGILILRKDGSRTPLVETSLDEWQRTQEVNLTGTFLTLRAFLSRRTAHPMPTARIVTLASSAAQLGGYRSSASYIASKSGILGLTKAAAREAAPLGITVNAVAPGSIDAPMLRLSLAKGDEAAAVASIPLGRLGTPDDVAGAVSWLMGPDASYTTGAVIDVNGGVRMQ